MFHGGIIWLKSGGESEMMNKDCFLTDENCGRDGYIETIEIGGNHIPAELA